MNTIIVPFKSIPQYDEFPEIILSKGFIFNKCYMTVTDWAGRKNMNYTVYLLFQTDLQRILCSVRHEIEGQITYVFFKHQEKGLAIGRIDDKPMYETEQKAAMELFGVITDAIIYILQEAEQRKIQLKTSGNSKVEYSRECKRSSALNKIYLLDDIINYMAVNMPDDAPHFHRTCPCWEVRGFYRHYKNGKTVWIKPHKRGKDRLTAEPKNNTYVADKNN